MKIIGVIGTRRRDAQEDYKKVKKAFLKHYEEGDAICSGLCPKGGDRFAVMIADELGICDTLRVWFPPNWERFGKSAAFIRNGMIAMMSDILIACVAEDRKGGTEDTIRKFMKLGKAKFLVLV